MSNSLLRPLAAAALLLTAVPAFAGSDCVTYAGLEHCALGAAGLQVNGEVLEVSGTGDAGKDGVAAALPSETTGWQAGVRVADADNGLRVTLGAVAGGEEISQAVIEPGDGGPRLSATFTGSAGLGTYSILIYRNGALVGSQGGVQSDEPLRYYDWMEELSQLWQLIGFFNRVSNGACVWTFGLEEPARLILPDGTEVTGDEIHFVEEVAPAGHYPYVAFDGITLRSSRDLQITSEVVH